MSSTQIDIVYDKIYEKIIDGTFRPGEKLHIANIAKQFEVGLSPVREALSKLTSTQLVIAKSQRGFIVAPVSLEDFVALFKTKLHVDLIALELSITHGDENWEAHVLGSLHRLVKYETNEKLINTDEKYKTWVAYHHEYFTSLFAACGLKNLLAIDDHLYHQLDRYRRIFFKSLGDTLDKDMEYTKKTRQEIADAAINRDIKKAADVLKAHFEHAIDYISKTLIFSD